MRAIALGLALSCLGCGPGVDLDAVSETGDPRATGTETGTGSGSGSGTSDGTATTADDLASTSVGVTSDEPPKLDVAPFDLPPSSTDLPMYDFCLSEAVCAEGLECIVLAYGKLIQYSICTAPCFDPAVDCDPAPKGWSPVCALDLGDGQGRYCAIGCNEDLACPEGTSCHELFVPDELPQRTCLP